MAVAQTFRVSRVSVSAGVKTAIAPPVSACQASIGNATSGDVEVHTTDDNDAEYLVIAAGYERNVPATLGVTLRAQETAFWLKPAASGTVVILWLV
jgi:hypothetical protein